MCVRASSSPLTHCSFLIGGAQILTPSLRFLADFEDAGWDEGYE